MVRKTKQDWLHAGLILLGSTGSSDLTIDQLTKYLGVTKGSFYHHFNNYQDFVEQLLTFWETQYTEEVIHSAETSSDPLNIIDNLIKSLLTRSSDPEAAIRAWALQDKGVRMHVQIIDQRRSVYLQQIFLAISNDENQARLMTNLLVTMLIGCYSVIPRLTNSEVEQLYSEFKRLYKLGGRE
jgi:AcrR family transcriptional regulator